MNPRIGESASVDVSVNTNRVILLFWDAVCTLAVLNTGGPVKTDSRYRVYDGTLRIVLLIVLVAVL
eukprot:7246973-Pyramimonas_sp.AAC.1